MSSTSNSAMNVSRP